MLQNLERTSALSFCHFIILYTVSSGMFLSLGTTSSSQDSLSWRKLRSIPNELGVAGPVCGTDGHAFIVAGGANFPDAPPWKNGRKVWNDDVYVLEEPEGNWVVAGKLPRPIGYAVSLSIPAGLGIEPAVAYFGGSDAEGHYADCWLLRWTGNQLVKAKLPSLPSRCANACGAILDGTVYVAGGLETSDSAKALHKFWALNLRQRPYTWNELPVWPGPERMLANAAVLADAFYLMGGVSLSKGLDGSPVRKYLQDAYRYRSKDGWTRIADMPRSAVAAAYPAPIIEDEGFLIMGGDDGSLVDFRPLDQHPGFPKSIMAYQASTDSWQTLPTMLPASHVTTSGVMWRGRYVIPSGEIRPGVRSPEVWSFNFQSRK